MKFTFSVLDRHDDDEARRWPTYMFGGRMRTSTLALMVAFLLVWWLYDTYRPHEPANSGPPPAQVVPPGFVPDPNYTWVPRSQVQAAASKYHFHADDADDHGAAKHHTSDHHHQPAAVRAADAAVHPALLHPQHAPATPGPQQPLPGPAPLPEPAPPAR